jgi:hypothetical protein
LVIDPVNIVGNLDDFNAFAADPAKVRKPKLPVPQPPKAGSAPPRYRRILNGVPTWTDRSAAFADGRNERQLKNWERQTGEWRRQDNHLSSQTGTRVGELQATAHYKHQARTKGQQLLDSTRIAAATHTHPSGHSSHPAELWPRLDQFDDQADGPTGFGELTGEHLRDPRTGPQFWQQPERRGKARLPQAVRYENAVFEFIRRPQLVQHELSGHPRDRDRGLHHTLLETLPAHAEGKLPDAFEHVGAWVPECEDLAVEGVSCDKLEKRDVRKRKKEAPILAGDVFMIPFCSIPPLSCSGTLSDCAIVPCEGLRCDLPSSPVQCPV